jgi:predicted metal-dependent phosphoesterase TrpH
VTDRFCADLHVHSRYSDTSGNAGIRALRSAESFSEPLDLYRALKARGMDFVTVTDHNTLAGSLAIAHLPGTFLSCELDTWFPEDGQRVHVVALGLDEATFATADAARENIHDLVRVLREADVTHFLAHPLFDMTGSLAPDTVERMLLLFNVLEGRNGARTRRSNGLLRAIAGRLTREQLEDMAERQGIAPYGEAPWRKALTGGSDDHSGLFAASAFTEAGGDGTPQGFLRAVATGDCTHRGNDGDSRTLAHSIYAASFWKIREILRLDQPDDERRALGLLRKGFGRIGREVPVLEKTLQGVRSMAPGLYRGGDRRGPSWEELLHREIGSLVADPDGINAVDARELNRRLFVVAQRLADEVMGMHLRALLEPHSRMSLKRRLQSVYAVSMVAFLEIPYYFAWSFQTRDRLLQEQLRVYFLGERRHTRREKVAVLCGRPETAPAPAGGGARDAPAAPEKACTGPPDLDVDVTLLTCSVDGEPEPAGVVGFRALAWRPSGNGGGPGWVVPPLVEIADYIEEGGFSAVHTDSAAGQGLVALLAARLLHLPVTGVLDPDGLRAPHGPGDLAGRLRRRYLAWFYGHLDETFAPSRATARELVAAGVDPGRVTVLPPAPRRRPAGHSTRAGDAGPSPHSASASSA